MCYYRQVHTRNELINMREKLSHLSGEYTPFLNALNFAILSPQTPTEMFIYLFGDPSEQYFVAVHEPNLYIWPSPSGHHLPTLHFLIHELFNLMLPEIAPSWFRFFLDSDKIVPDLIKSSLSSFSTEYTAIFRPFYMSEHQMTTVREMTLTAPEGYRISEINADKDYDEIHDAWRYGAQMDRKLTRRLSSISYSQQLLHLPSSCVRCEDRSLASWELSHHFMKMSHHFTYPAHRNKGLGVLTEMMIAQRYIELGYIPFKIVHDDNVAVVKGTLSSPHWSEGRPYSWTLLRKKE